MVHRVMGAKPRAPIAPAGGDPDKLDARLLRIAGVCVLAAIMSILDTTVVSVAQRTFIAEFGSTQAVVAWTMTAYTLALASVIPVTGWAADRFGTKRLFMASVSAFTVGSILCAMSPNILALILFRVIQGLGGGMLMPLTFTILTREAGPRRLGRLMAVLGIPMLLGPMGGPILGGWLIDTFEWEWIFLINVPVGILAVGLAWVVFERDRPGRPEKLDVTGMALLSTGLASFLYGVSSIPGRGTVYDNHVWIPVSIGTLLIGTFAWHALYRTDHPLIDLRLFKIRTVAAANVTMFCFAMSFFGAGLLFPSYFQQLLDQTPLQSGVHLIPQGLGAILTMPIAGKLMDTRGPGRIVLAGITLITAGIALFAFGVHQQAPYTPILMAGLVVMGLGMGATMMPVSGAAVQALQSHQIARGSTLINVNQQVAGSIGTAIMSMILTSKFNSSPYISTAAEFAAEQQSGISTGPPPEVMRGPDFPTLLADDLSHAYFIVFAVAAAIAAVTLAPASLLPKRPAPARSGPVMPIG